MKKILLSLLLTSAGLMAKSQCTEIFISEYVEGWSNNRAIEIYNPTSNPIDLSAYELWRFSNGNSNAPTNYRLQLSGTVQPKDVYVFVKDSTGGDYVWDSLYVKADAYLGPDYNTNSTFFWNGNDAVAILKGGTPVDVIGKVGEDPAALNGTSNTSDANYGWPVGAAVAWTKDHTLIRKSSVNQGVTTSPSVFTPSTEWDSLPANTFDSLGTHTCVCNGPVGVEETTSEASNFIVYPNPSNAGSINVLVATDAQNITVYNLLGNIVFEKNVSGRLLNNISTEGWNKGIYLVSVRNDKGVKTTKKISITK